MIIRVGDATMRFDVYDAYRIDEMIYGDALARERARRKRAQYPPVAPKLTKRQRARQTKMTIRYAPGLLENGL